MGLILEFVFFVQVRVHAWFKNYVARVAYEEGFMDTLIQYFMPMFMYKEVQIL